MKTISMLIVLTILAWVIQLNVSHANVVCDANGNCIAASPPVPSPAPITGPTPAPVLVPVPVPVPVPAPSNPLYREIVCRGGTVIGITKAGDALFSNDPNNGKYREYPLIDVSGIKLTGRTKYGKVTVTYFSKPNVTWTNWEGEVSPSDCDYQ